jgi:hypothetical protein
MARLPGIGIFLFSVALALAVPTIVFPQSWRRIVPLHTNRTQVENLLGSPTIVGSVPTYYFNDERVEIFYARYPCRDRLNVGMWNVPPGTVLSINVIPKDKVRLADMHLDLSKFRKQRIPFDFPYDYSHLVNDEEGLTLSLVSFGKDFVDSYSYGPKATDRPLRCPDYTDEEEKRKRACIPLTFSVDCSSEEIKAGRPVECKIRLPLARADFHPTLKWTVSPVASLSSKSADVVRVKLINRKARSVTVTVRVVSPNVCFDSASAELKAVRAGKKKRS